jgi:predicted nuclease with TOPRIM domain
MSELYDEIDRWSRALAASKAEVERLKKENRQLIENHINVTNECIEAQHQCDSLRAEVEQLKVELHYTALKTVKEDLEAIDQDYIGNGHLARHALTVIKGLLK